VSRVLVTAALNEYHWAEWRHWVGRAIAEVGDRGLHLPAWLREKQEQSVRAGLDSSRVTARARPGRDRHPFRNSGRRRPRAARAGTDSGANTGCGADDGIGMTDLSKQMIAGWAGRRRSRAVRPRW
jgi:hypothetical protein